MASDTFIKRPRTPEEREQDLDVIEKMLGEGQTGQEIHAWLEPIRPYVVTRHMIMMDLGDIDKWYKARRGNPSKIQKVAHALLRMDRVERECWTAFERSKKPATTRRVEEGAKGGGKKTTEQKGQVGDPRFLDIILRVEERRAKLEGLDASTKTTLTIDAEDMGAKIALREAYRKKIEFETREQIAKENQVKAVEVTDAVVEHEQTS